MVAISNKRNDFVHIIADKTGNPRHIKSRFSLGSLKYIQDGGIFGVIPESYVQM